MFIIISLPHSLKGYFISTLIEIKICFLFLIYVLPKGKSAYQIIQMIITRTCYHRAIFGKCLLWQLNPTVRGHWAEGPNLLVFWVGFIPQWEAQEMVLQVSDGI